MPATVTTAPNAIKTGTGWTVSCSLAGGAAYGSVSWSPTGHATLTPAGLQALATQCGSYHGALTALTNGEQVSIHGAAGFYAVLNGDLATQQAAIVTILQNAANITGSPT